jgi:hypothetical protein
MSDIVISILAPYDPAVGLAEHASCRSALTSPVGHRHGVDGANRAAAAAGIYTSEWMQRISSMRGVDLRGERGAISQAGLVLRTTSRALYRTSGSTVGLKS